MESLYINSFLSIAQKYFDAFHDGRIEEALAYFSEAGVVKYGSEPETPAKDFFPETREMISQVEFDIHGAYTSSDTNNVIIHFTFSMPADDGGRITSEAIDIIEFNDDRKITRVNVITNG